MAEHTSKGTADDTWKVSIEQKEDMAPIRLLKTAWAVFLNQALGEGDGTANVYQAVVREKHSGDEVLSTPLGNHEDTAATVSQMQLELSTLTSSEFLRHWSTN
ncbi:hypothetical protein RF641_11475 [Arthrobacter sp. LS16]|uniref:hypothetical protein n=1 Tax=Arthrobacter sp. 'calajunan' TaxID=1690248 RepID=UPI003C775EED